MFDELAITARDAIAIGASIYLSAFLLGIFTLLLRKPYPRALMFTLLAGGFIMQTLGLNLRGAEIKGCPLGNIFEISQFIAWSLVLLYFIIGPAFKLRLLGFFTAGLAGFLSSTALLIHAWDSPYPPGIFGGNPWIELHAALAIFSYGIFAIVSVVSFMFLVQQHGLKKKQFKGVYQYLPSVQQLDLMAKRLLITGVLVLSAALIFGAVFWISHPERVPVFKLSATCLVWAGYLTVVVLRIQKKLVTRRHALASIGLFIFALASLWPVQSARDTTHIDEPSAQVSE
ncbi:MULTISPECIES: inner membrane protein YpjD [unclassified Lentimonas]|uniref:cytochrome C assembly family protein n=1 Tax=unclassified Lentimonas TaxID=2630993 RepID=UPI001326CC91|nr:MULTISPECIES: cytochrome c biogenesis protein CcsA [unclassified Lentimonas]CAA6678633.1 HemX protein, negative effector of steady-state concentration of glutamyl-tRNA reductase [Lentimonas sp. CC4]CAA6683618.1 HemX protein, negative effector of steady-state concentration of glutamyl-tRNA reductase [Lentimonas sp. CC6]CAA6691206.1 HemX protein, negative effector of steady-state concentration of glutamyl-tRNA reductase [Lentimonas sp. CC19]CAA6694777.1 HemX protein, negative effector of stead